MGMNQRPHTCGEAMEVSCHSQFSLATMAHALPEERRKSGKNIDVSGSRLPFLAFPIGLRNVIGLRLDRRRDSQPPTM